MVTESTLSVMVALGLAGGALGCYAFAWYSWRRASHPVAGWFAPVMVADGSWALFSLFGHLSPTAGTGLFWRRVVVVAAVFAAAYWFRFVAEYTADSDWLPDRVLTAVWLQPLLYVPFVVVNPGGLVFTGSGVDAFGVIRVPYLEFGPLMLLTSLYTFVLLFTAFGFLGRFLLRSRNLFRKQAAVIFAVNAVIVVSSVLFVSGLTPQENLDVTPILFAVNALGTGVALYRYDFLDVEPMAAHTLLEEMDDPVFVVDTRARLVDWNDAADAYVTGSGDGLADVAIPDLEAALQVADGGSDGNRVVTVAPPGDGGGRIVYDVRVTRIPDRYGIVRGHAIALRDITQQERQKRVLETQNERLEEFTGVVSHDLRSPLQVIDGRIELARQTGDLSHLGDAADAVDRMETLLDDLLELAREGRVVDEKAEVDLADCCDAAWQATDTDDATLLVETDATVVADDTRLQQVFENLFRNAVEHGDPGVTVTVGDTADGFYVADDGPGIPESERESVFEMGATSADDGSGFGLAIVERVVEAHGWTITAGESESGGARFEVSVAEAEPLVAAE